MPTVYGHNCTTYHVHYKYTHVIWSNPLWFLSIYFAGFIPLKRILAQGFYELRIDLTDFEGNASYAKYETFDIGEGYKLWVKDYTGTAGIGYCVKKYLDL